MDQCDDPQQIGPYQVIRCIAKGGMGCIYLAQRSGTSRTAAIKVLLPDANHCLDRFRQEASLLKRFRSKHTVRILDEGEDSVVGHYFVMEYLEGDTLFARIRRGSLPWQTTVAIASQICLGLQRFHRSGIVHRDLKTENIALTTGGHKGRSPIAKVLDFGLAKQEELVRAGKRLTLHEHPIGTAQFAAPEQLADGRDAQTASDVYSIGLIIHECLTGKALYKNQYPAGALLERKNTPLPNTPPRDVPQALWDLMRQTLEFQPARRPKDATALLRKLREITRAPQKPLKEPRRRKKGKRISGRKTHKPGSEHPSPTTATKPTSSPAPSPSAFPRNTPEDLVAGSGVLLLMTLVIAIVKSLFSH